VSEPLEWHIGRVRVTRVEERVIPVPWSLLVPAGEELVGGCRPWMDPFISASARHLLLSIHSFIVETPETVIVVDTCIGDSGEFQMPGDAAFEGRLVSALPGGLDSVDTVVCTHLHFDHVGWNTVLVDGVQQPRFPNARYLARSTSWRPSGTRKTSAPMHVRSNRWNGPDASTPFRRPIGSTRGSRSSPVPATLRGMWLCGSSTAIRSP
jgi:hypothetical protein